MGSHGWCNQIRDNGKSGIPLLERAVGGHALYDCPKCCVWDLDFLGNVLALKIAYYPLRFCFSYYNMLTLQCRSCVLQLAVNVSVGHRGAGAVAEGAGVAR